MKKATGSSSWPGKQGALPARDEPDLPASERIYRQLKEAILSGDCAGGTRLVEVALANDFAVSRTPVREALKRLAVEDLVSMDPIRGLVVRPIDAREIADLYAIREVLDGLGARLAAQRITPQEVVRLRTLLEAMRDAATGGSPELMVQANVLFHEAVFYAAGNERLKALGQGLTAFVQRLSAQAFRNPVRDSEVVREHEVLVDAIARGDANTAEAAARQHMVEARNHFDRQRTLAELSRTSDLSA